MLPRLLLICAIFLVSTAGLFAHRALAEATPLAIAAWRLGLASVFFLVLETVSSRRQRQEIPRGDRVLYLRLAVAGLCLALHFFTWFAALQTATVARATLLVCTTPLWTTLGSRLLGRGAVTPVYWLALGLAGIGIALVTGAGASGFTLGDAYALLGGALFAVYLLLVEGLHTQISSRRQVTVAYSVAAAALWLLLLARGGATLSYSPGVWKAILGMTLGPQIFGHTLLNSSLRHFPSSVVAFAILGEPVIAAALAWVLFHQAVTPVQIIGGLLVLSGLGLVIARQTPAERVEDELPG